MSLQVNEVFPEDIQEEPKPSPQQVELSTALAIINELGKLDHFARSRVINWVRAFNENIPSCAWDEGEVLF